VTDTYEPSDRIDSYERVARIATNITRAPEATDHSGCVRGASTFTTDRGKYGNHSFVQRRSNPRRNHSGLPGRLNSNRMGPGGTDFRLPFQSTASPINSAWFRTFKACSPRLAETHCWCMETLVLQSRMKSPKAPRTGRTRTTTSHTKFYTARNSLRPPSLADESEEGKSKPQLPWLLAVRRLPLSRVSALKSSSPRPPARHTLVASVR
jgi:hypothetical protein